MSRCWRMTPCSGRRQSGETGAAPPTRLLQHRRSPPLTLWYVLGLACTHMMCSVWQWSHLLGTAGVQKRQGSACTLKHTVCITDCISPVQELLNRGNYHIFYVSQKRNLLLPFHVRCSH